MSTDKILEMINNQQEMINELAISIKKLQKIVVALHVTLIRKEIIPQDDIDFIMEHIEDV